MAELFETMHNEIPSDFLRRFGSIIFSFQQSFKRNRYA